MNADISFLEIYVEICLGTTAFFAIVATLKQSLGEPLSPYQYLITRYFIDCGLLITIIVIAGLGIHATQNDSDLAWQAMSWLLMLGSGAYQMLYLKKRIALKPRPPSSKTAIIVMFSSLLAWLNLGFALAGVNPMSIPSAAVTLLVVSMAGFVAVFLIFIGSFMKIEEIKA